ncbi:hypothetical protein ACJMK2_010128 [Sinanodonta woodiana]|uniref:P2X purinoreceptor 7 intracellular domain-containing protein n=1 Tax=Sinanodonta woodiana TaxID=1069815 RepID=A0ABD3VED3_SINWO
MATACDDSDVDDIPEVEYSINHYMYEPEIVLSDKDENDSSDSDTGDDVDSDSSGVSSSWCLCSKCIPMTNQEENICCHSQSILEEKIEECSSTCITNHEGFIANCLNIHVLETSFYEYVQENVRLRENDQIQSLKNKLAFWFGIFVRWVWKIFGKRNRKILPSCVVSMMRKTFSSETYTGLKYPRS